MAIVLQDGKLIDRKYGHGASVFNPDGSVKNRTRSESILKQARDQVRDADGKPIRWEVSTEVGADGIRELFRNTDPPIDIEVVYVVQKKEVLLNKKD